MGSAHPIRPERSVSTIQNICYQTFWHFLSCRVFLNEKYHLLRNTWKNIISSLLYLSAEPVRDLYRHASSRSISFRVRQSKPEPDTRSFGQNAFALPTRFPTVSKLIELSRCFVLLKASLLRIP